MRKRSINILLLTLAASMIIFACNEFPESNAHMAGLFSAVAQTTVASTNYQGLHCGSTASTYTGARSGYVTIKSLCETACGSSGAFVCSDTDMVRSAQRGLGPSNAVNHWLVGGYGTSATDNNIKDCRGWNSALATDYGRTWVGGSSAEPDADQCANANAFACCTYQAIID